MRILVNEFDIDEAIMTYFEKAACACMEKEGIDPACAEISLSFVDGEEIRQLNRDYRGVDSVTDVLSFPIMEDLDEIFDEDGHFLPAPEDKPYLFGDVVICRQRAEEQAAEYGHSLQREFVYLFTHSVLHLLGYDHMNEEDKREMRAREEEVMSELGLTRQTGEKGDEAFALGKEKEE